MSKTFVLIMHEVGKTGSINAMKRVVSEEDARILMQDDMATIYGMKGKAEVAYTIKEKKFFEFDCGENKVLFIVANVTRTK